MGIALASSLSVLAQLEVVPAAPRGGDVQLGLLVPGPTELAARAGALREKLGRADAVGRALTRVHNRLAERLATGLADPCRDEEARSLLGRSGVLGRAYRDAAQAARAEGDRLSQLLVAETLSPLLHPEDRSPLDALVARTEDHARRFIELSAWHQRFVVPALRRCNPPLTAAEGIAGEVAPASDSEPVAIIAVGGGRVCPSGGRAEGGVLILSEPRACYGGVDCACEPRPVLPGAVLGP